MRKLALLLLLSVFTTFIGAQTTAIPDSIFEQALINLGYDTGSPDGTVPTANINTVTSLNVSGQAISDLTGIEDFTALTNFNCEATNISIVDFSNNTALTTLNCGDLWLLTSFDVSNNVALTSLQCHLNGLGTLDVSNNIALTTLGCGSNNLSALDVSNNTALTYLDCGFNGITSLDLRNNIVLTNLECGQNQLTSLNVKNGNNINFTSFSAVLNFNLYCIEVDDPAWSTINWLSIDPGSSFSANCHAEISGKVVIDTDCILQGAEQGLVGIVVKTGPEVFYGITNQLGEYTIFTDTGTYQVEHILPNNNLLINPLCPTPNYYTVNFDSLSQDTTNLNFYNDGAACQLLTTDISSNRRRRCFENHTYVQYCNEGFADATNVQVHVQFPDYVSLVSADMTYTIDVDSNYVFNIGNLAQGACGTIHIIDSVACINGITGLTQCTKAWITPANTCADSLDPNFWAWDKSSITIPDGECIGDTTVRLVIWNHGSGDMSSTSEYRIYSDNQLVYTGSFQLTAGDSLIIEIAANGTTIRLEADQHSLHPGNSQPRTTIKGCGNGGLALTFGLLNASQMDDADVDVEIHCLEIRDSYDPNDKTPSPEGITANRYVKPGTQLDYMIRFQNTGSDTAYTVVVVDTLSADLDISTIQWGVSSHPYTIDVSGQGRAVVTFTFNNINLPDSTTDEAGSQGFVKFKINPETSLANGTVIHNEVDIYFDFNLPITTNDAWVTIFDTTIIGTPITVSEVTTGVEKHQITTLKIVPNPFTQELNISLPNSNDMINPMVNVYNLLGKKMSVDYEKSYGTIKINGAHLTPGVYFIEIRDQNKIIGRAKVIKK